jgi:CheY-like chemotaxis protein
VRKRYGLLSSVKRYVSTDLVDVLVAPLWTAIVVLLALCVLYLLRRPLGRMFQELGIKRMSFMGVDLEWVTEQTKAVYDDKPDKTLPPPSHLRSFAALSVQLAPLLNHRRVLWVDNTPRNNVGETRLLRGLGVDVENELTTDDAFERLEKEPARFDLVISNWTREKPDEGPRLLKQLRAEKWNGPFLFYVADASKQRKAEAAQLGAVVVTTEPDELLKHALVELSTTR